jgi:hypothetical protein
MLMKRRPARQGGPRQGNAVRRAGRHAGCAIRRLVPALILCSIAVAGRLSLSAMDWPTENGFLVSNFGWNRRGRPLMGLVFETRDAVRAVEDGDILFVHDPASSASRLPSPLGFWAAVDHGDGLISMYGRLDPARPLPDQERVSRGLVIAEPEPRPAAGGSSTRRGPARGSAPTSGSVPASGSSPENGRFYFSFYDKKERRWINPAMIIAPQEDAVAPLILQVELRNGDGQGINPAQGRRLTQGRYAVVVTATDSQSPGRAPALAPHRIICSVNGMEIGVLAFETYSARDGALMAAQNGLIPVRQVYAPAPGWEVGELWLTRGQATLEIIVQDVAGNTRNALYRLQVE